MSKMLCEICAGEIPYEDDAKIVKCPYCGSKMNVAETTFDEPAYQADFDAYARQNQQVSDFLRQLEDNQNQTKDAGLGTLKLIVPKGKSIWSLADGSTFWFKIDETIDVRVPAMKKEISASVELPFGTHTLSLMTYGYDDKDFTNAIDTVDPINIYVPKNGVCTVTAARTGLFASEKLIVL